MEKGAAGAFCTQPGREKGFYKNHLSFKGRCEESGGSIRMVRKSFHEVEARG